MQTPTAWLTFVDVVLVILALFGLVKLHTWLLRTNDKYARFFFDFELYFIEFLFSGPSLLDQSDYEWAVHKLEQWVKRRQTRLHDLQMPSLNARLQKLLHRIDKVRWAIAELQRERAIQEHYSFSPETLSVDPAIKRALPATGGFVRFTPPIPLRLFPSFVAGALKYKKHEWRVIGFEVGGEIVEAWVNKGENATKATLLISLDELADRASNLGSTCVLDLHNHPNPDPTHLTTLVASDADYFSAEELYARLEKRGIGLISFVCERGMWLEFFRKIPSTYLPAHQFLPRAPHLPELFGPCPDEYERSKR